MPAARRRFHAATVAAAMLVAAGFASHAAAQPACAPGGTWAYTGSAKGKATVKDGGKFTLLEFSPAGGASATSEVVFASSALLRVGTYQVNGDIEVTHLESDAAIVLSGGASSAAAGRDFDVAMAAGDGGSSSFSRPIDVTPEPFAIEIRMKGSGRVSLKVRNYNICRLR